MSELFANIEEIAGHVKEYINVRIDKAKLTTAEKSSLVLSNIIAGAILLAAFLFSLLFASIAAAYMMAGWMGKPLFAGFLVVAGFYFLTGLIIWAAKERLIRIPVMNSIIQQLFKHTGDEENQKHRAFKN